MKRFSLSDVLFCGLDNPTARELTDRMNQAMQEDPEESWIRISRTVLHPALPFRLHTFVFESLFKDRPERLGPPPAWKPTSSEMADANITKLMVRLGLASAEDLHAWSVKNREIFWSVVIEELGIAFSTPPSRILNLTRGPEHPIWLEGARMNITQSCLRASAESVVIIAKPEEGPIRRVTAGELEALSNRVANALVQWGYQAGDPLAIDMPMTVEAVAIYLGIIKAGGVVVSIPDSFAPHEIATRLRLSSAKAVFCQNVIRRSGKELPLYERIVEARAPQAIVIPIPEMEARSLRPGDILWDEFLSPNEDFEAVIRTPEDRINILFSSGTTGEPKAIPWSHVTPIKCASDARYHHDIRPGDVIAWPTSMGWMMGPWLIFAALINRATIALFEGAPTTRAFGEFVQESGVNVLGVVPSIVRAWRNHGTMDGLDWSAIRCFSSTGEVSSPEDMLFCMSLAGYRPIIEYCGGTEIGGGYLTGSIVKPCSPGTFNTLALGMDARILDGSGAPCAKGEMFLVPPSLGLSTELLNKDHHEIYFDGTPQISGAAILRRHGDQVEWLPGGFFRIHGRMDDTMNLGGIKVGSAEIENTLRLVAGLSETAAIGVCEGASGPLHLVIYAVRKPELAASQDQLLSQARAVVREQLNPLFKVHDLVLVRTLPKTASNKIMRGVLRDHYVSRSSSASSGAPQVEVVD